MYAVTRVAYVYNSGEINRQVEYHPESCPTHEGFTERRQIRRQFRQLDTS